MSRYEEQSPSYRTAMIDAGRGHLLSDGPRSFPPPEFDEDLTCVACQEAPRLKDHDLCAACRQDMADDLAERDRCADHPGTRCTDACGHCGRCS